MKTKKLGLSGLAAATVLALSAFATSNNVVSTPVNGVSSGISAHAIGFNSSIPSGLKPLDSTNSGNQLIPFAITLNLRHEHKLEQLIADQANPNSPHFQKYLSVKEFTDEFGPTAEHYLDVINFLTSNDIRIRAITPNRLLIEGEGTNDQLAKLFGTTTDVYQAPNGEKFFKPINQVKIPSQLKGFVKNIIIEDSANFFHNNLIINKHVAPSGAPTGYGPQQIDTVYDYPNANNSNAPAKTFSGRGVTIAIATAQTYSASDVNGFWNQFGITRTGTVTNIAIGGVSKSLNPETTLDLEQIGSDAPGANILMYESKVPSGLDFAMMFNRIATDNKADVVSHSWGASETGWSPADIATEHEIFMEMNAQGMAVFAASGDSGAYDSGNGFFQSNVPSVDYPSSDPFVTAVGGTTLVLNGDNSRDIEVAWYGAGGGVSSIFGKPVWQVGPGVPTNHHRDSADVSMDADPATGMPVLYQNQWMEAGGTSFAAPNWAAGWGLAIEEAGHRIAMPDMYIYKIANSKDYSSIFYDVTYGNNGDNGVGPGFNAGTGYDHPTGWGTPDMANLANWLANYKAIPPAPAPVAPTAPTKSGAPAPVAPTAPTKSGAPAPAPVAPTHGVGG